MADLERHVLPNGAEVFYDDAEHKYFVDGKEVPSVTTILKNYYGNMYSAVNPDLLKASAEYGTAVHAEIDSYVKQRKIDPNVAINTQYDEVRNFFTFVEPIYKVDPIDGEKVIIVYDPDGNPFACGRFDMLCNINNELTLADIKTTSAIHRQSVTGQLNLYATGALQCGYITLDQYKKLKLAAIHLNKGTSKVVPIAKLADNFYMNFMI